MSAAIIKTEASQKRRNFISKFLIYFFLIVITACMLLPFLWMLSSSFKLNKDVFGFPIQWIPKNPRWQNYVDIWTQIPLLTFVKNTVKITVVVTLLQLFTSSFAAYAFAKMQFKGKNALFLGYIATIAVPWQAYMVPQFMMMSSWHLNNTHLAIMCLQAFSAFGVFLMKQFYEGVPTELCEAARIDGLSEYGIWWHIMLPLSLPALSTLTIFTFVKNTVKITVVVTLLQLFTSSFAAYAFAKMQFKGKNVLFLGYIATIAVPWQAYMVPQFMMMSSWHLNNTHLAIMCLQAFSAFGVFLMKQFYEGVPTELCEAARIDGLSEYGIWWHIMLPLSLPALSTLTIFTFVNTWNDFLGPLIYLTKTELKTIQIGLRMFITQYSAEYGLIMAASVVALIPVLIVFLSLQKYFVQGVASTGIKG